MNPESGEFAVIVPAAGRSSRFGDPAERKVFADLDGRAVWHRAVEPFLRRDDVAQITIVIGREDRELFGRRFGPSAAVFDLRVVEGGAERHDSVARALAEVPERCRFVAVHDAARPCLTADQVDAVFAAARRYGAALLAVPVADTLKRVDAKKFTTETVPRHGLYQAQTPQVFRREWLVEAYARRDRLGGAAITDDTQLVEALGHPCAVVESTAMNLKITTVADLRLASAVLRSIPPPPSPSPGHPFADTHPSWEQTPKIHPDDLFGGPS